VTASDASKAYESGDIEGAVAAAIAAVKAKPADTAARGFLCELLCFQGAIERVDKHLDLLVDQEPDLAPGLSLFRQILRGEAARREVFEEGRAPEFIGPPPEHVLLSLKALAALRAGQPGEALELTAEAEAARPKLSGRLDETRFSDWRDLDDITAAVMEVITAKGTYYWVPLERIRHISFDPPKRPRDLIWRQAHIDMVEGPDAVVYIPCRYAGTEAQGDDQLSLARATSWVETPGGPVRGAGLRTFLFDETDRTVMEVGEIEPDLPEPAPAAAADGA